MVGGQNENWRKDTFGTFGVATFVVERNALVENQLQHVFWDLIQKAAERVHNVEIFDKIRNCHWVSSVWFCKFVEWLCVVL